MIVVGTDCPQLTAEFVAAAFTRLSDHDLCVAPAIDGGYVLIGVNTSSPPTLPDLLFQHIDWGTKRVLSQTLTRVEQSAATCAVLPTLSDVDIPADLVVWQRAMRGVVAITPTVSVIIPTYNEEPALAATIDSALAGNHSEIIVVAAGRFHNSVRIAAEKGVQCLVAAADRGARMNLGATHASADVLLFLHADTQLPVGYAAAIARVLGDSRTVGGAFQLRIDSPRMFARWVERGTSWRSTVCRLPYGDQAIFVRRQVFAELAGFRSQTIMEDYEFVRRLRRAGKLEIPQEEVRTSARRWEKRGFLRTTLINQCMLLGYHLGVPLDRLAKFYRGRP